MFRNIANIFTRNAKKLFIASTLTSFTLLHNRIKTSDIPQNHSSQLTAQKQADINKKLRVMNDIVVCKSNQIAEGQMFCVEVDEQKDDGSTQKFPIIIVRFKKKLYAVGGRCTFEEPLNSTSSNDNSFKDAIVFNDKLYCPHHGCAFSIVSGTVQYGPAYYHLSRFFIEEKQGKVILHYPSIIPKKVLPKTSIRDYNDLRKVVILGGDHHATMGCLYGLRQYDFQGQITVLMGDDESSYPYHHDKLHRNIQNFKKDKQNLTQNELQNKIDSEIFEKLKFQNDKWYEEHGIEFFFNTDKFRIINKRFYPYVLMTDRTKVQFDGLVASLGIIDNSAKIPNLHYLKASPSTQPSNVFLPYRNKYQYKKLMKFLNLNPVKNLLVVGLNKQSLEFCSAVYENFPDVQIKMLDMESENKFTEMYGPDIAGEIFKSFKSKGMEFYVNITSIPFIDNWSKVQKSYKKNSILVSFPDRTQIQADGAVLFPNSYKGDNKCVRGGKFTDLDFTPKTQKVKGDPFCRTDTKRIFAAGASSTVHFFFTGSKLESINPNVAYEQGWTSAFNLRALKVPFHYIPFEKGTFLDKTIFYVGTRLDSNSIYILGSVQNWDFIAIYALNGMVTAASASPSRQKELQVLRESFRVNCIPEIKDFIEGKENIPSLYRNIRKLDKSACYRDQIHEIDEDGNIPDVIWMQRTGSEGLDDNAESESPVEVDSRGYLRQL